MAEQKVFDPVFFVGDLHKILSQVTVSGPANIHNMDLALQGLGVLQKWLQENQAQRQETAQREEI